MSERDKIIIKKNPNGDTRTAKGDITFEDFQKANDMHIKDVLKLDEEKIAELEKENADLEAQIEKMKCCGNCQKLRGRFDHNTHINILYCSDSDMREIEVGFQMCCCKWEIKEK